MIKHFCDFCDQEKSEEELNKIVLIDRKKIVGPAEEKDICRECTEKIWKQKIDKVAPVQQPKKEETKKRVRNVDHGKIVALSKAGWKIKQICEEMHVSEVTVYNHLKMEKEHEKEQGM